MASNDAGDPQDVNLTASKIESWQITPEDVSLAKGDCKADTSEDISLGKEDKQISTEGETEPVKRECRVMIIGRTGSGKSTLGNRLLGRPDKRFKNPMNAVEETAARNSEDPFFVTNNVSGTKTCQFGTTVRNGITLTVVDTPGLFDTDRQVDNKHVLTEMTRGLLLVGGEPHAFIIVVELGRVTQEVQQAFQACTNLFKTSHIIVAFSRGEQLEEDGLSIKTAADLPGNNELKAILDVVRATGMYVVVTKSQAQVDLLMEKINKVSNDLRNPWSDTKLQEVANVFKSEVEKIMHKKHCNKDVAAIKARTEISKWDGTKELLIALSGFVGLFLAGGGIGVVGTALLAGSAITGEIILSSGVGYGVGTVAGVVMGAVLTAASLNDK